MIDTIRRRYRAQALDRRFILACAGSVALLAVALIINYFASIYASDSISNSVTDIILSNIPVFDVDGVFLFGPVIFWTIAMLYCLAHPGKLPFTLKSVALFIVIRSIFITLTHLGPYPDSIPFDIHVMLMHRWNLGNLLAFGTGGDLFFSGHTGLPFLFALMFWKDARMRLFCLASAVFFGIVVLLGHLHYSIDVLSAFFITYSIYHLAEWLFKKDRKMFYESPEGLGQPSA